MGGKLAEKSCVPFLISVLALGGDDLSLEGNLTIHRSLLRAVGEIRSLAQLTLGDIDHLSADDLEPIRKLDSLITLDAAWPRSADVRERFLELQREVQVRRLDEGARAGSQPASEHR